MSDLTTLPDEYNPSDLHNLAKQLVDRVLAQPTFPLSTVRPFEGAGVYALYYRGDFPTYAPLIAPGAEDVAIYVGRAVDAARTGLKRTEGKRFLYGRMSTHRESIRQASNLDDADFLIRWLIVAPIFVPLAESGLIESSQPAWNGFLPGFGSNDPGKGHPEGVRSPWDTLHPGRNGIVPDLPLNPLTSQSISDDVLEYLRSRRA